MNIVIKITKKILKNSDFIIEKPVLQVILSEDEDNFCAKCCKTKRVIDQMLEAFPDFKERIEIRYKNIDSHDIIERYGELTAPVIILNDIIFSEGHVPIIKRLCREILDSTKN